MCTCTWTLYTSMQRPETVPNSVIVVSEEWIEDCLENRRHLPTENYIPHS